MMEIKRKTPSSPLGKKYPYSHNESEYNAWYVAYQTKKNAKSRNIEFCLDLLEVFEEYCLRPCFYCGVIPNWPYEHNGVDRVNNNVGYIKENCVACCAMCNLAKNKYSIERYMYFINKLHNYSILNIKNEWLDLDIEFKIENVFIKNEKLAGERRYTLSKKYPESYNLHKGSYAQFMWNQVKTACKKVCKNKNVKLELDALKAYETYIIGICNYCGLKPQFPHTRNGIDRIDSSKGYTEDNCVACCVFCNRAKNDYTLGEFKEWIIRVYTHLTTVGWNI